jgi:hypothetical protein
LVTKSEGEIAGTRPSTTLNINIRRWVVLLSKNCKKTAYITLVRSIMDYGGIIWDPYLKTDVDRLERIQHQAARFITGDYKTREPGCITKMLIDLELPTLEKRRTTQRLIFMFKVVEGLVPAISPSDFVTKTRPKRFLAA